MATGPDTCQEHSLMLGSSQKGRRTPPCVDGSASVPGRSWQRGAWFGASGCRGRPGPVSTLAEPLRVPIMVQTRVLSC